MYLSLFLFLFIITVLTKLKYKTVLNPILFIIFWWSLWSSISILEITNLYRPIDQVFDLVLLMLFSLLIGSLFSKSKSNFKIVTLENKYFEKIFVGFFNKSYKIVFVISLYYFLKAITILMTQGLEGYRALTFSNETTGASILFGNVYIEILHGLFISSYIYVYLFIGLAFFIHKINNKIFYISIIMLLFDSLMRMGRFGIYHIIFLVVFGMLFRNRHEMNISKKVYFYPIILIVMILYTGSIRESSFIDSFKNSLYNYHTVGLTLLSSELNNQNSYLNSNITFGEATFGGLDYYSALIIRRIVPDYQPTYLSHVTAGHAKPIASGTDINTGYPVYYNAFYTIIYSLYSDGREFTVFLIPLIIGYFLGNAFLSYKRNNSLISYIFVMIYSFLMFFSIFQTQLSNQNLWLLFLIMIFFKSRIKSKVKRDLAKLHYE